MDMEWYLIAVLVVASGTVQQSSSTSTENAIFKRARASSEMKQVMHYLTTLRSSIKTAIGKQPATAPTVEPLQKLLEVLRENIQEKNNINDLMDYLRVLDAGLEEAWHELTATQSGDPGEGNRAVEIVIQFIPVTNGLVTDLLRSLLAELNGHSKWSSEEL